MLSDVQMKVGRGGIEELKGVSREENNEKV